MNVGRFFVCSLDLEAAHAQRSDHLEREKAEDVDGVVRSEVEVCRKIEVVPESLGFVPTSSLAAPLAKGQDKPHICER